MPLLQPDVTKKPDNSIIPRDSLPPIVTVASTPTPGPFLIKSIGFLDTVSVSGAGTVHTNGNINAASELPQVEIFDYTSNYVKCMSFTLSDVKLNGGQNAYYGTAMLNLGGATVPVYIIRAGISHLGGEDIMTDGSVFIEQPFELSAVGLTLVSLDISPHANYAKVSGYIKSTVTGSNLAGDLYSLKFEDANLTPGTITISKNLPDIRYRQLKIYNIKTIVINLNAAQQQGKDLLSLQEPDVAMKFHLETLSNEGLEFETDNSLSFDTQGRLSGRIFTNKEQILQLLVPGGAGLRAGAAELEIADGEFKSNGKLIGKLVIPFEKTTTQGPLVPAIYAGAHPAHSELDDLASGSGVLSQEHQDALNNSLVHYGQKVQQNSLLILPKSFELQDKCASASIYLVDWSGEGFVIKSATMDNVRVTNRNLSGIDKLGDFEVGDYYQREQALILSGGSDKLGYDVSIDLSREDSLPKTGNTQGQNNDTEILTPKETEKPFWVGIVVGKAELELPSKYLRQADGSIIRFNLAEGEMLYDLNGFNYQTYLYGSDPEVCGTVRG